RARALVAARLRALGRGACGPYDRAELAELLGDRGERRVGLVQAVERVLVLGLGRGELFLGARDREAHALAARDGLVVRRARLLERGLQVQDARGARRAAQIGRAHV